jgi:ABC-type glycerol-3-phosphate transport system permease component
MTSLKDGFEIRYNLTGLPEQVTFSNYAVALSKFKVSLLYRDVYMPEMYLNSILYAGGGALVATFVPCLCGYLTGKFVYNFSRLITGVVIFCMIMPVVGSLPSEIQMAKNFNVYNSIWGTCIMKFNFLGMYFLVFQTIFKSLAKEYTEAAKIDGADNFMILFRIMLPLVKNTFFTVFLILFIQFWNDYQIALVYIPDYPTVALGAYKFSVSQEGELGSFEMKISGAMLVFIPIFIVYAVFNKRLMGNLTLGGVKG